MSGPKYGTTWRRTKPPIETRHVVDRTFGGHVDYIIGRWSRFKINAPVRCDLEDWLKWQKDAKQVK